MNRKGSAKDSKPENENLDLDGRRRTTYKERFLLRSGRLVVELSGLDDLSVDSELALSGGEDVLFDRLARNESEDLDDLLLTDSMGSVLGLQIGVRVPVGVVAVQVHRIGSESEQQQRTRKMQIDRNEHT